MLGILELSPKNHGLCEYIGEIRDSKPHGFGIKIYEHTGDQSDNCIIGEFNQGEICGIKLTFRNRLIAEGVNVENFSKFKKGNFDLLTKTQDPIIDKEGHITGFSDENIYLGSHITINGEVLKKNGKGLLLNNNKIYLGEFKDSLYHGFGILYTENLVYVGHFIMGMFFGSGVYKSENVYYKGNFYNNYKHGKGELILKELTDEWGQISGRIIQMNYCGDFFGDLMHGNGVISTKNNFKYNVTFKASELTSKSVADKIIAENEFLGNYLKSFESFSSRIQPHTNDYEFVILDIETQKSSHEVNGWHPEKMGLAIAVTYSYKDDYIFWEEYEVFQLIEYLKSAGKIIGFNLNQFDLKVLDGYKENISKLLKPIAFDLLEYIEKKVGFRLKLQDLTKETLNKGKTGEGLESINWWKERKIDLLKQYCKHDVELTKELYEFGLEKKKLFYLIKSKKMELKVDWQ